VNSENIVHQTSCKENSSIFNNPDYVQWLNDIAWYRTPIEFKEVTKTQYCHNLICQCEENSVEATMDRLEDALNSPGSYYYYHKHSPPHPEMSQGVMYIYSKSEKVAARVRFGD